jgi:hypothetical protein
VTPLEFLQQEYLNVHRTLDETLRYEYGPEASREYYDECKARLSRIQNAIKRLAPTDLQSISDQLDELSEIADWIFLIERSHLGEFSWPFAEAIRDLARQLLSETNLSGEVIEPIIHVVAEGEGYQIVYERQVPTPSTDRRFTIVAFPRPLKHHVLLHALFGHELGHTALKTADAGQLLVTKVIPHPEQGALADATTLADWLTNPATPSDIRLAAQSEAANYSDPDLFFEYMRNKWRDEFFCDLFGLLLFGPGFMAAHRAYLGPRSPVPFGFSVTHPPDALRQRLLVEALKILKWTNPATAADGGVIDEEEKFLKALVVDPHASAPQLFDRKALAAAVNGGITVLKDLGGLEYKLPPAETVQTLVKRLADRLPPINSSLNEKGEPVLIKLDTSHILYAGWVYWHGRLSLSKSPLDFFTVNRLCDQALLQQRAINDCLRPTA